ncbi:hypothetical protein [Demequina zhanjiangensis]|uniref:Uncharacterized protein n=1 Tax=Demequina zhanjiangensis TaxID=3051659 RepID=A0ABT8G2N5_9MICO|nr:hypothetical protein [Demequina sp. SYSU T00b26]MDN4473414.1 hypothetical protein [Demequina sp. SYSU T00b26]
MITPRWIAVRTRRAVAIPVSSLNVNARGSERIAARRLWVGLGIALR